ncbi:hypothetical protein ACTWP7_18845 [Halobacillus sp. B29]
MIKKLKEWAEIIQKHQGNMDEELVEVFLDMCGYAVFYKAELNDWKINLPIAAYKRE